MPSRTKLKNTAIAERSAALPKIPLELLDQFLQGPMTAEVRIPKSAPIPNLHPAAQAPGRLRWCPPGGWGSQIEDARQYGDGTRGGGPNTAHRGQDPTHQRNRRAH